VSTTNFKFSFISIVLLGINYILGSGIFLLPQQTFIEAGSLSLWVLLFVTILVIFFGLCFAEMAGKYSKTGGAYSYAQESFNDFIGFQVGFLNFFSAMLTYAISAVAISSLLSSMFPIFANMYVSGATSIVLILISSYINIKGVKISEIFNNIVTLAKLIPILLFCVTGIFFISKVNLHAVATVSTQHSVPHISSAIILLFYAFAGFEMIPITSQEMKNPMKNIPLALLLTIFIISAIYFVVLLNCIGILGPSLATSSSPLADAMKTYFGKYGFFIVFIGGLLSIFGLLLASSFGASRTLVALGNDRFIPHYFSKNNKNGTPSISIIAMAILTILVSVSGTFAFLVKAEGIVLLFLYLPTVFSVVQSRRKKVKGSFKIPFASFIIPATIIMSLYIIFSTDFPSILYGLASIVFGILIYYLYSYKRRRAYLSQKRFE
jgi:amino acid transporter